jgi:hypothetical protein
MENDYSSVRNSILVKFLVRYRVYRYATIPSSFYTKHMVILTIRVNL